LQYQSVTQNDRKTARMFHKLEFRPLLGLSSAHLQTIIIRFCPAGDEPPSKDLVVKLQDGDQISCQVSTPESWEKDQKTVVLLHGLGGSHLSNYMVRMARKLYRSGINVVRMNLRGCGSGAGLNHRPYHAGNSSDIHDVLVELKKRNPESPITFIGYSLGGGIALKLAGEKGDKLNELCERLIIVCPPIDLTHTIRSLSSGFNRVYHRYYLKNLCKQTEPWVKGRRFQTLNEYDDQITANVWGFSSSNDYYQRCSAARFISNIEIPCDIVFSADDPFIDYRSIEKNSLSSYTTLWLSQGGGHNGFLGSLPNNDIYWLDKHLLNWITFPIA
jgi:uncharacterized protein